MTIVRVPMDYYPDARRDPAGTSRNYFSIARGSVNPFFTRRRAVQEAMNVTRVNPFNDTNMKFDDDFQPADGRRYYMHVDLGTTHDSTGISMAHVEGFKKISRRVEINGELTETEMEFPIIYFDFIGSISAPYVGESVMVSDVRDLVLYELRNRGFYVRLLTFDRYGSLQVMQDMRRDGFTVAPLSLDRTTSKIIVDGSRPENFRKQTTEGHYMAAWESLRDAIYDGRVDLPYHDEFLLQCKRAEEDRARKKVKSALETYSLDMLESIAGTVFNIVNNEKTPLSGSVETEASYRQAEAEERRYQEEIGITDESSFNDGIEDLYKSRDEDII